MNEGFQVRLRKNTRTWPIETFTSEGIVLGREQDAFPRSVTLEFDARSEVTAYRMNRVRQLKGWPPSQFNLKAKLSDGKLSFTGDDPSSLPGGAYWVRIKITDLKTPGGRLRLNIDDDEADAQLDVNVQSDPRTIDLTTDVAQFDPEILRVLQAPESVLDDLPLDQWLDSGDPRPSRKACLLNLMAKLRTAPSRTTPLIADVTNVFLAGPERIYCQVNAALLTRLQALANDEDKPFYYEGNPASPTHLKLLDQIEARGWGQRQDYTLHSFRQEGRTCLQIVVAAAAVASQPFYADFDIDLGNPLQDVVGFVVHMGELAFGGSTDHLKLRDKLAKGATKAFLYYTVE